MAADELLRAIGTLHCPHCQMPLFANALGVDGPAQIETDRLRFVAPFIMILDDAIRDPGLVVEAAEAVSLWSPSAVVGEQGARHGQNRTNEFVLVSSQLHETLGIIEAAVRPVFHAAARAYAAAVGHLQLRSDLGYQLLRYGPGQRFTEHVDEMPGATVYGQRQVTAILYLNDDFEGGELELPQQGLVYKPRAGDLMMFPAGFCFPHASREVRHGTKYSVVTWFI